VTSPISVAGYPSKTAAAIALRQQGKTIHEISRIIGTAPRKVNDLIRYGGQGLGRIHVAEKDPTGPFTYAPKRPSSLEDEIYEAWQRAQAKKFSRVSPTINTPPTGHVDF